MSKLMLGILAGLIFAIPVILKDVVAAQRKRWAGQEIWDLDPA